MNKNRLPRINNNKDTFRYAGLGVQLLAVIGIAIFIGIKADQWLHTMPLFSCVLPLIVLIGIFYKLMQETSAGRKSRHNGDSKPAGDDTGNKRNNETK